MAVPHASFPTGPRRRESLGLPPRERSAASQRAPLCGDGAAPLRGSALRGRTAATVRSAAVYKGPAAIRPALSRTPGRMTTGKESGRRAAPGISGGGPGLRLADGDGRRRMLYGGHSCYTSQQVSVGRSKHPLLALRPASGPHTPSANSLTPPTINGSPPSAKRILSLPLTGRSVVSCELPSVPPTSSIHHSGGRVRDGDPPVSVEEGCCSCQH